MPDYLTLALKEWAVTQRALMEGHQIILLRKGGLIEDTGDFDLRAPEFLLYPTYEHETERAGDLQPCFGEWLREEAQKPTPGQIRISAFAQATDIVRITHPQTLNTLSPQHIWSPQFVQGRFDWEPYKPVFAIIVRAYALSEARTLPVKSEYGGCRSWVTLEEPIETGGATPALSDRTWERRRELTLKMLTE